MKSTLVFSIAVLTALGLAPIASAATVSGFSGKWPLTVTDSKLDNGNHCLTLTDDGSAGWPHSGPAIIHSARNGTLSGTFQFIDHIVLVSIDDEGQTQNASSVYALRTRNSNLGDGGLQEVNGGQTVDSGEVVVGPRGGS